VQSSATKGILNVEFFVTNFSKQDHREDVKRDAKMKEFCRMLKTVFEKIVFLDKYPRSQIDL
jgi:ribonuclease PH